MRKFKLFLLALTGAAILMLGGCKEKQTYDEAAFENDMEPLTDDELKAMDEDSDDEMTAMDEEEMEQAQDSSEKDSTESTDHAAENKMDEKGTYTDKNDVAQYIYEYGHAPSNLTPENYENADSMLPVEEGVTYQQCSLDPEGKQKLIYTQDGKRVYYTEDDGKTWTMLPEGSTVSMNMWGFSASILKELKDRFPKFLDENLKVNPLKCEYFLPFVVDELLGEKRATVKVLKSMDKWYGVTYKEDKPVVVAAIQKLKDDVLYPQRLWEE